jgi:hypothetical protein
VIRYTIMIKDCTVNWYGRAMPSKDGSATLGLVVYLHFQPDSALLDPPTNLTGRAWSEILKSAKKILARVPPETLFLVILHYKIRGRPARSLSPDRARSENWDPMRPMGRSWVGFSRPEITEIFRPGPNPARTAKCWVSTSATPRRQRDVMWADFVACWPISQSWARTSRWIRPASESDMVKERGRSGQGHARK